MDADDPPTRDSSGYDRGHETAAERLDRNWIELLQEIRVLQTGAQVLAGFLVVLPFQGRFADLDAFQTGWYIGLLLLSLLIVALLLTPVGMHRRLFRRHVKDEVVAVAHALLRTAILLLGLLLTGVAVFVLDVVLGRGIAIGVGVALAVLMSALLVILPARIGRRAGI